MADNSAHDNQLDSMTDKDRNEDTVDTMGISDKNKVQLRRIRAPTVKLAEKDSFQEGDTVFLQHDVPVVGAGLPTSISFPVPVTTITDIRKVKMRCGAERYEIISDSFDSSDDASDD